MTSGREGRGFHGTHGISAKMLDLGKQAQLRSKAKHTEVGVEGRHNRLCSPMKGRARGAFGKAGWSPIADGLDCRDFILRKKGGKMVTVIL